MAEMQQWCYPANNDAFSTIIKQQPTVLKAKNECEKRKELCERRTWQKNRAICFRQQNTKQSQSQTTGTATKRTGPTFISTIRLNLSKKYSILRNYCRQEIGDLICDRMSCYPITLHPIRSHLIMSIHTTTTFLKDLILIFRFYH